MKVYNTLSRKKEDFAPINGNEVRMYSCGPTVYNFAHIGNLRTYIFMDLLRRGLKLNGFELKGVMNITDVGHLTSDADDGEDKMEKAARQQKKDPYKIAEYYTNVFFTDFEKLNINIRACNNQTLLMQKIFFLLSKSLMARIRFLVVG